MNPLHSSNRQVAFGPQRTLRHVSLGLLFNEPGGQRVGQLGNGEFPLVAENRAHHPQGLPDA